MTHFILLNISDIIVVVGAILGLVLVGEAPGRDCEDKFTIYLQPNCKDLPPENISGAVSFRFNN